jgi:signal transduction histidine kinase
MEKRSLRFYRWLFVISGLTYILWWGMVEWSLPGSFNPLGSRVLVSSSFFIVAALSYFFVAVRNNAAVLYSSCAWLLTLHYFYLFKKNNADINWVVGSYITVIAVWSCLQGRKHLIAYSIFVLIISVILSLQDPVLMRSIFLAGMLTMLVFANMGARTREKMGALREGIRVRDEFISMASHELKTPLTTMRLYAQFEKRCFARGEKESLNPAHMLKFVDQIERQTNRLARLVDSMLDVSRISRGVMKLEKSKMDLRELILEVTEDMKGIPGVAEIKLSLCDPVFINGDRDRMGQVIGNLIDNALKFGERKPIHLDLSVTGGRVCLKVKDHGLGIAPEHQLRIFEKFERALPLKNISGLGMGLFIVKEIIEAHSGNIELESESGKGATFTVFLPILES